MKKLSPDKRRRLFSLISSLILHLLFFVLIIIAGISSDRISKLNTHSITLESGNFNDEINKKSPDEKINVPSENINSESKPEEILPEANLTILNPDEISTDTTNLDQIYTENTLNLSIKYPGGWTYIDQTKKNKLDGVTFWSVEGIYNPPPYIHLEVVEKYLFNPARYKYKVKQFNCEWYFNDPVKLEEQISQEIYIRTDEEEDFSVKLIMTGEEQFRQFQPKFFAIVRSLEFGKGIF
jgi:hypothetical protein